MRPPSKDGRADAHSDCGFRIRCQPLSDMTLGPAQTLVAITRPPVSAGGLSGFSVSDSSRPMQILFLRSRVIDAFLKIEITDTTVALPKETKFL